MHGLLSQPQNGGKAILQACEPWATSLFLQALKDSYQKIQKWA